MAEFTSSLPQPRVDLPSGASVQFAEHRALVDEKVAVELRSVIDEAALGFLALAEVDAPKAKAKRGGKAVKADDDAGTLGE